MSERIVARRYARALYEEASSEGRVPEVDADIDLIRTSLSHSPELVHFFKSPLISRNKKESIIDALFRTRVSKATLRFMHLIVEKEREDILPGIVEAYRLLRDELEGVVEAKATVAYSLSQQDEERIRAAIEGLTGRRVRLEVKQDPGIIGGIVVRVGDTVYDGTVYHQLQSLRDQLQGQRLATNGASTY